MGKPRVTISESFLSGDVSERAYIPSSIDLIVFSQIRWNFVWQRPQHLMSRWARERRVYYIEEPISDSTGNHYLDLNFQERRLRVVVPHLKPDTDDPGAVQKKLVDMLLRLENIQDYMMWYLTPMAIPFTSHLRPRLTIYDCMDELSAFHGAPAQIKNYERELLSKADVVFTGGMSLYEAKQHLHSNMFPFPSSIDYEHFHKARQIHMDPPDQQNIPHPRIGFFGVIDERMDRQLIDDVARLRPDWQLVLLGPVVKINPELLPQRPNIHYLGNKAYQQLPAYISGWDVAMLPFALNDSTRFISPTKTPEYLAAGRPVVSTSIRDVVRPYAEADLVHIADNAGQFVRALENALKQVDDNEWLQSVDAFLAGNSWDNTWQSMKKLMCATLRSRVRLTADDETPSYPEVTGTASA